MKNEAVLHYGGILVAILGLVLFFGPFGGFAYGQSFWTSYFSWSDVLSQLLLGIIFIVVGVLLFLFFDE